MLNITVEEISAGIKMARIGNSASFLFKGAVLENPTWQDFIDHIDEEIHTPMENPIQSPRPFDERLINGVMLKSLFYMDARVRSMEKFSAYNNLLKLFTDSTKKEVYPASVFVNFVANEYNVPRHCDKRETIFWQCIGKTFWHVYPPESEFPVSYNLEPGDILYIPKGIDHEVIVKEPRAAIAFGYENEI